MNPFRDDSEAETTLMVLIGVTIGLLGSIVCIASKIYADTEEIIRLIRPVH